MNLFGALSLLFKKKPRKVALVIVVDASNRVLVLRRSIKDQWMPGKWALPGGHVEKDESFAQAAVRELNEETNLSTNVLIPFVPKFFTPKPSKKIQKYYIAPTRFMKGTVSLKDATHGFEHDGYCWISPSNIIGKKTSSIFVPGMKMLLDDFWRQHGRYRNSR